MEELADGRAWLKKKKRRGTGAGGVQERAGGHAGAHLLADRVHLRVAELPRGHAQLPEPVGPAESHGGASTRWPARSPLIRIAHRLKGK